MRPDAARWQDRWWPQRSFSIRGGPIRGLRDSKQLTPERARVLAQRIRERALGWAVAEADHEEIDLLNILQATLLAMKRALLGLSDSGRLQIMIDGNCAPQLA